VSSLQKDLDDARFRLAEYDHLPRFRVLALSMSQEQGDRGIAVVIDPGDKPIPFGKKLTVVFMEDE
jgi:hypothetical protein